MAVAHDQIRTQLKEWIDGLPPEELLVLWRFRHHRLQQQLSAEMDPGHWIDLESAAAILSLSVGHLRRICLERLIQAGQAKKAHPISGGKPRWYIRRDFDSALLSVARVAPEGAQCAIQERAQ